MGIKAKLTMEDIGCNYPLPVYDPPVFLYRPSNITEDRTLKIEKHRTITEHQQHELSINNSIKNGS